MSKRIGVVTGGGDCPGLNAVIRAVAKASAKRGWDCIGVLGGYEGLLEPQRTIPLDYQRLSGCCRAAERFSARPAEASSPLKLATARIARYRRNYSMR